MLRPKIPKGIFQSYVKIVREAEYLDEKSW